MTNLVKRFSLWTSWNHEGEEAWLDQMSEQGLHLEHASLPWSTFTNDPSTRYVYRLDYQSEALTGSKFAEYINLYADAGWEYKSTYMGRWHYFRQPWKAGERQELYTDRTSLREHYQRIQRILAAAFLMNLPIALFNLLNSLTWADRAAIAGTLTVSVGLQAAVMMLTGYGVLQLRRKVRDLSVGE